MIAVKIVKKVEAKIPGLPELDRFVGREVELIVLDRRDEEGPPDPPAPMIGTAKGEIWMSEDFDAPLEDFKDYM